MNAMIAPKAPLPRMRLAKTFPVAYDPLRRLYARVILQAIYDLDNASTGAHDRLTAKWFLLNEAQFIVEYFELDEKWLERLLLFVRSRGWY